MTKERLVLLVGRLRECGGFEIGTFDRRGCMDMSSSGIHDSSKCGEKILVVECSRIGDDFGLGVEERAEFVGCGESGYWYCSLFVESFGFGESFGGGDEALLAEDLIAFV